MEEEGASLKMQARQTERKQDIGRINIGKPEEGASQAQQTEKKQETRRRSIRKPLKKTFKKAIGRSISRCTRSQVAPKWTKKETMILLNEIACQDHELAKALPSNQRWKIVAEGCGRMDVNRSSNDCKRRWDSLLAYHNKIRVWESSESSSKLGSYWSLEYSKRKKFQLPASFDEDMFGAIGGVIEVQEALSGSKEPVQVSDEVENDKDSVDTDVHDDSDASDYSDVSDDSNEDSERTTTETEASDFNVRSVRTRATKGQEMVAAKMFGTETTDDSLDADADSDADADPDAGAAADSDAVLGADIDAAAGADIDAGAGAGAIAIADTNADADSEKKDIRTTRVYSKEQETANKLRENAKQILAILKGELPDDVGKSQIDLTKTNSVENDFIKRQAGELIKGFEVLASNFDQFNNLINKGSCEGINFIKPMGP